MIETIEATIPTSTEEDELETAVYWALQKLGVTDNDENFQETPRRFAAFLREHFLTEDQINAELEALSVTFPSDYKGMLSVLDTPVHGMCPHHLLPIRYKISIAYIPKTRVLGLSKIARLAGLFGRQAAIQEDVTQNILEALETIVPTLGTMVVVHGIHSCMSIRGVKVDDSLTVTSAVSGVFLDESKGARNEFLALTRRS